MPIFPNSSNAWYVMTRTRVFFQIFQFTVAEITAKILRGISRWNGQRVIHKVVENVFRQAEAVHRIAFGGVPVEPRTGSDQ